MQNPGTPTSGPQKPGAVVSTSWLAEHLNDPDLRIVDATWAMPSSGADPKAAFVERHIPGAVFFDIDAIARPNTDPLPHMLPSAEDFAAKVGAMGIGSEDFVVCYDTHGLMTAARAWWMFRVFGHDRVAVLDGGLPKWVADGHPVVAGQPTPAFKTFTPAFRPDLVRSKDDIRANIDTRREQVVDARAAGRFDGSVAESWPGRRAGHIPGSRNLPFTDLLDPASKVVLPAGQLRDLAAGAGVSLDRPVVASCGSGVTACVVVLGLYLAGRTDVAVYDGSWAEWGLPGDTPVATGPAD